MSVDEGAQSDWHAQLIGVAPAVSRWLADQGSLTERISQRCADFNVDQVSLRMRPALPDERTITGLAAKERAWLRDVYLRCGTRPVIFAHSVLPTASLFGYWSHLTRLGNRSLGALLFADPLVRRSPLQFRRLDGRHFLYRRAIRDLLRPPLYLWARRSLLMSVRRRILVTEVFLPDLFEL